MPLDETENAFMRGQISRKAASRHAATRGLTAQRGKKQNTRMADFDDRRKDEGDVSQRVGGPSRSAINEKQAKGSAIASPPTKGGGVHGAERQPVGRRAIDQNQKPSFPAGAKIAGKGQRGKPTGPKLSRGSSRIPPAGPQYGGGGRNTQN